MRNITTNRENIMAFTPIPSVPPECTSPTVLSLNRCTTKFTAGLVIETVGNEKEKERR